MNTFVHRHEKPLVYDSGEQVILQVTIFATDQAVAEHVRDERREF